MTEYKKKTQQIRSEVITDLEEMQQLVTGTINDVTQNVKTVHQKIASLPADYVGQIKPLENVSKDVQKVQEKTLGYAYDLIKVINTTFNGISKDIITKTNRNIL